MPLDNSVFHKIGMNNALRQSMQYEYTQTTDRGDSLNHTSLDRSIDEQDSLDQFSMPKRFQTAAQNSPRKARAKKQPILSNSIHFKQSQMSNQATSRMNTSDVCDSKSIAEKMSEDFVNYARRQANQDQLRGKITMRHKGEYFEHSNKLSDVCDTPDLYKSKQFKLKNEMKVINNLRHSMIMPNTAKSIDQHS